MDWFFSMKTNEEELSMSTDVVYSLRMEIGSEVLLLPPMPRYVKRP